MNENLEQFDDNELFDLADISTGTDDNDTENEDLSTNITIPTEDMEEFEKGDESEEEDDDREDYDEEEEEDDSFEEATEKVKALQELGYLILPDDYKIESVEKAIQDSEYNRENISLQKVFNKLPDQEIEGYGSIKELFKNIVNNNIQNIDTLKNSDAANILDNLDLENTADQKKILTMFYKAKGFSDAKANKYIERAEDSLELDEDSKEAYDFMKEDIINQRQLKLDNERQAAEQKEKADIARFNELKQTLTTSEDFGNYKIPKTEKEKALHSLYRPVTIGDGTTMTEFDYRLNEVVLKDPKLTLALSDILNRITKDNKTGAFSFDFSNIRKAAETTTVKNYKKAIDSITNSDGKGRVNGRNKTGEPEFDWGSVI